METFEGAFVLEQVGNKARSLISIPKFEAYLLEATN